MLQRLPAVAHDEDAVVGDDVGESVRHRDERRRRQRGQKQLVQPHFPRRVQRARGLVLGRKEGNDSAIWNL